VRIRTPGVSSVAMFARFGWVLSFCIISLVTTSQSQTPVEGYEVIHVYPHDPEAFTQGLLYVDGHLYESTGRNGQSSLRMVDLTTGRVLQKYDLPAEYFGEGLTGWGSDLIQLTWTTEKAFIYDRFSFSMRRTMRYKGEGWGLTRDEKSLILSDGSSILRFLDPQSFREVRTLAVTDRDKPVKNLNELEYVRGEIYANIWETDRIARISPRTGKVIAWIDLRRLIDKHRLTDPDAVLNGIAYDAKTDKLFVTGKLWPNLFEIRIIGRASKLKRR
jgi:glutamine cyclotransferase